MVTSPLHNGRGSSFSFTLPCTFVEKAGQHVAAEAAPAARATHSAQFADGASASTLVHSNDPIFSAQQQQEERQEQERQEQHLHHQAFYQDQSTYFLQRYHSRFHHTHQNHFHCRRYHQSQNH